MATGVALARPASASHARGRRRGRAARDLARALLRPRLRRRDRAARGRAGRGSERPWLPDLRRALRRRLVGLGRLHVLRRPLRHGRSAAPRADAHRHVPGGGARLRDPGGVPRRDRRLRACLRRRPRGRRRAERARVVAPPGRTPALERLHPGVLREHRALPRLRGCRRAVSLLALGARAGDRPGDAARQRHAHPGRPDPRLPHPGARRPVHDHRLRGEHPRGRHRDDAR